MTMNPKIPDHRIALYYTHCYNNAGARMPLKPKLPSSRRQFICPECRFRLPSSSHPSRTFTSSPQVRLMNSSKINYLHLSNRTLIRLAGPDAANFLHNIIPAKILDTDSTRPVYTAFLSAHGRILNDVFAYPPSRDNPEEWFLEVDAASA